MTVDMKPGQSEVIAEAIRAGLIQTSGDALDIAVDALRSRLLASAGSRMDADEWMRKFRALAQSRPVTPPLSEEAIRRESIYGQRGS